MSNRIGLILRWITGMRNLAVDLPLSQIDGVSKHSIALPGCIKYGAQLPLQFESVDPPNFPSNPINVFCQNNLSISLLLSHLSAIFSYSRRFTPFLL